jgi:hypothetical protein
MPFLSPPVTATNLQSPAITFFGLFLSISPDAAGFLMAVLIYSDRSRFFLLFMPGDRAFSIDSLRNKLNTPFVITAAIQSLGPVLPITCLLLSALAFIRFSHTQMFAEHWRNGLGPATRNSALLCFSHRHVVFAE